MHCRAHDAMHIGDSCLQQLELQSDKSELATVAGNSAERGQPEGCVQSFVGMLWHLASGSAAARVIMTIDQFMTMASEVCPVDGIRNLAVSLKSRLLACKLSLPSTWEIVRQFRPV